MNQIKSNLKYFETMLFIIIGLFVFFTSIKGQDNSYKSLDDFRKLQNAAKNPMPTTANDDFKTYFPLQKGNIWEYKLVIPQGGWHSNVLWKSSDANLFLTESGANRILTFEENGTYSEKYEIIDVLKDSSGKKEYSISGISKNGWSNNLHDVYWKVTSGDMIQVDELFASSSRNPIIFSESLGLSRNPFYRTIFFSSGPPPKGRTIKLLQEGVVPEYERSDNVYTVNVPAGVFSDCIEIIEQVKTEFKIYFYYAPSIGLILRYQTDIDGNPKSYMELVEYRIGSKKFP